MRILILGLNFHPELTGIGKYTGELADYLHDRGHELRVITTPPYYPHWRVQPGYRWWTYRRERRAGMLIYRCPLWVPRRQTGLRRLVHLFSFALSSIPALVQQIFWRPDLVLCIAPAFFSAPGAWLTARLCGARSWLHLQDFELDAAVSLELLPEGHVLTRLATYGETWLLRRFDWVSTISERMLARLQEKGVRPERAGLLPNWVDTGVIHPLAEAPGALRRLFDLPEDKFIVLYSGSMGAKQGLENVVAAARLLQSRPEILFVFCGAGSVRAHLETLTQDLPNVRWLPLQPPENLNALLNAADVHMLPQRAGAADLVMPSKLLGMLASGRATITTAGAGTAVGEVVAQAGVVVPPDQPAALSEAITSLAGAPQTRSRLGAQGRALVCERWSTERLLDRFHDQLLDLAGPKPSGARRPAGADHIESEHTLGG